MEKPDVAKEIIETIQIREGDVDRVIPVDEEGKPIVKFPLEHEEYGPLGEKKTSDIQEVGRVIDKKV